MKYNVILTRDITESTIIEIEADNVSDAEDTVMAMAGRYGQDLPNEMQRWQSDECVCGDVYVTGVDPVEEKDA